jgi:dihydroorotate dehydrogenase
MESAPRASVVRCGGGLAVNTFDRYKGKRRTLSFDPDKNHEAMKMNDSLQRAGDVVKTHLLNFSCGSTPSTRNDQLLHECLSALIKRIKHDPA